MTGRVKQIARKAGSLSSFIYMTALFGSALTWAQLPQKTESPAVTFSATPASITKGQSTILRWKVTNAATVSIEPNVGAVEAEGSREVTPETVGQVKYTLVARGKTGNSTWRETAMVLVNAPAPKVLSFTISPPEVDLGAPFVLAWQTSDAIEAVIEPGIGVVPVTGTRTEQNVDSPQTNLTYTLTIRGEGPPATRSATVTLGPRIRVFSEVGFNGSIDLASTSKSFKPELSRGVSSVKIYAREWVRLIGNPSGSSVSLWVQGPCFINSLHEIQGPGSLGHWGDVLTSVQFGAQIPAVVDVVTTVVAPDTPAGRYCMPQ